MSNFPPIGNQGTAGAPITVPDPVSVSPTTADPNSETNPFFDSIVVNGNAVAAATPLPVSPDESPNTESNPFFFDIGLGAAAISNSNPLPIEVTSGGAVNAVGNPEFVEVSLGGAVNSPSNPFNSELIIGGAVNAVGNPAFVEISLGGAIISSSNPLDVSIQVPGDPIRNFVAVDLSTEPETLTTHTVNASKVFKVRQWEVATEQAICEVELQFDGVMRHRIRFDDSSDTRREPTNFSPPLEAAAGVVVRVQAIAGDTGKEFLVGFNGVEEDA